MSFREREILKTIYEQIKILQEEGTEEEVIIFITMDLYEEKIIRLLLQMIMMRKKIYRLKEWGIFM